MPRQREATYAEIQVMKILSDGKRRSPEIARVLGVGEPSVRGTLGSLRKSGWANRTVTTEYEITFDGQRVLRESALRTMWRLYTGYRRP